jgi:hypothetical protein
MVRANFSNFEGRAIFQKANEKANNFCGLGRTQPKATKNLLGTGTRAHVSFALKAIGRLGLFI